MINQSKKHRMMKYFIDATYQIIQQEGINCVTNRKVAKLAGYNSATLYNYFENLDHLVFMACMKFIKPYSIHLLNQLTSVTNCMERIYIVWDVFCDFSFIQPNVYRAIFFADFTKNMDSCFQEYFLLYPEDMLLNCSGVLKKMFLECNIYVRGRVLFEDCVANGYFNEQDIDELSDRIYLIYEGILFRVIRKKITSKQAKDTFHQYFTHLMNSYKIK